MYLKSRAIQSSENVSSLSTRFSPNSSAQQTTSSSCAGRVEHLRSFHARFGSVATPSESRHGPDKLACPGMGFSTSDWWDAVRRAPDFRTTLSTSMSVGQTPQTSCLGPGGHLNNAAMGTEWRLVVRHINEPDPFPLFVDGAEVFRREHQLFGSTIWLCRVNRHKAADTAA